MTESNNHTLTDNQNEKALNFLRDEIASLKSRLTKKEERIASMDALLNLCVVSKEWTNRGKILVCGFDVGLGGKAGYIVGREKGRRPWKHPPRY